MSSTVIVATLMRPDGDTGVQAHFRSYVHWLRENGRGAEVITPYDSPRWQVYPVFALRRPIHHISRPFSVWWYRYWHTFFLKKALRRRLRSPGSYVVYAQCPLSADAAMASRKSPEQKVVIVVHFNVSQAEEWAEKGFISKSGRYAKSIKKFEARVLPLVDGVVHVSQFMRLQLTNRIPETESVLNCIVPNFVSDPGLPSPVKEIQADLLSIGTLEPRKNQAYALEVIAAASSAGVPLRLTIAGDGPDRKSLIATASRLGVAHLVRFLGRVPEAGTLFSTHRACLHVARMENLPIALIEATAHGAPIFAAAVGGVSEVFSDGVEGWFIPLDDAEAAARIIVQALANTDSSMAAGNAARCLFLRAYESSRAAMSITKFLDCVQGKS